MKKSTRLREKVLLAELEEIEKQIDALLEKRYRLAWKVQRVWNEKARKQK